MHYFNKVLNLFMFSVLICASMFAMGDADDTNKGAPPKSVLATLARDTVVGGFLGSVEPVASTCNYFTNAMQPKAGEPATSWMQRMRAMSPYPRVWYSGFGTLVGGMAPITALQNGCAEGLNQALAHATNEPLTDGQRVATAGTAGAISALVSNPQELLVLYQQNAKRDRNVSLSTSQAFNEVRSAHGTRGLYRGFWPVAARDGGFVAGFKALPPILEQAYKPDVEHDQARWLAAALSSGLMVAQPRIHSRGSRNACMIM